MIVSENRSNIKPIFILITTLFFLWGFAHNLDPILIPHLKRSFELSTAQSTLVDSSVYIAYFIMAIPAGWIMKRVGYRRGIIIGLTIFSIGSFLFIPAAEFQSYHFFLIALFVIACGLAILETVANPYVSQLGAREDSAQRLNLAQSFNGLAAALAPMIGARIILVHHVSEDELSNMEEYARKAALAAEAHTVKGPYFLLGMVLLLVAAVFSMIRLPMDRIIRKKENQITNVFKVLRYRHLRWGIAAQFFYVGAQVSIFSLFLLYATQVADISQVKAADYLGICGIAFLVGRFVGTLLMRYISPNMLLFLYSGINIFLCILAMTADGMVCLYTVIMICFFMSIMFPTIFALAIDGLMGETEYGSSLVIMSIVGGAVLPYCFGVISDIFGDIRLGYIIPLVSFAVIAIFGIYKYNPDTIYLK